MRLEIEQPELQLGEMGVGDLCSPLSKRGKLKWLTITDRNVHKGREIKRSCAWRIQKNG